VAREGGDHTQLTLLVFDAAAAVLSSDWRVLGITTQLSDHAIDEALRTLLDPLGRLTPGPIVIQPVPVELLGEPRPPLELTCEEDPSLSVTLPGDAGFFIPDWPFGGDR
jgi:hypothetical protein